MKIKELSGHKSRPGVSNLRQSRRIDKDLATQNRMACRWQFQQPLSPNVVAGSLSPREVRAGRAGERGSLKIRASSPRPSPPASLGREGVDPSFLPFAGNRSMLPELSKLFESSGKAGGLPIRKLFPRGKPRLSVLIRPPSPPSAVLLRRTGAVLLRRTGVHPWFLTLPPKFPNLPA